MVKSTVMTSAGRTGLYRRIRLDIALSIAMVFLKAVVTIKICLNE